MSDIMLQVPEYIEKHLKDVIVSFGLPNTQESEQRLIEGWLEKKQIFHGKKSTQC